MALEKIDYDKDLAILRTDKKYKPIKINKNESVPGDKIYAIGNSSNNGIGITEGIISRTNVSIEIEENKKDFIQLDIAVANGNSGGALLDNTGKLIGIITFRIKDSNNDIVYGFSYAIGINTVLEFLLQG